MEPLNLNWDYANHLSLFKVMTFRTLKSRKENDRFSNTVNRITTCRKMAYLELKENRIHDQSVRLKLLVIKRKLVNKTTLLA